MAVTFKEWEQTYNEGRPVEPCCESENAEQWAEIVFYAEDNLQAAFEAGYQSCTEECKSVYRQKKKNKISFIEYYFEQVKDIPIGWRLCKKNKNLFVFFAAIMLLLDPLCIYTMYLYDTGLVEVDKRYQ